MAPFDTTPGGGELAQAAAKRPPYAWATETKSVQGAALTKQGHGRYNTCNCHSNMIISKVIACNGKTLEVPAGRVGTSHTPFCIRGCSQRATVEHVGGGDILKGKGRVWSKRCTVPESQPLPPKRWAESLTSAHRMRRRDG